MGYYRKKPVVIEAMQFTGNNSTEIQLFVGKKLKCNIPPHGMQLALNDIPDEAFTVIIPTLEGDMTAHRGDWIIKGIKNEFYPCKPEIFDATYDEVVIHNTGSAEGSRGY